MSETRPTPILDRLAPLPPPAKAGSRFRLLIAVWICLLPAIGAALAAWSPPFVRSLERWILGWYERMFSYPWTGPRLIGVGLVIAVLVLATIAIHEGAHVVVGAWVGFRLSSMRVGRIQIGRPFRISIYRGAGAGAGGWLGGWANLLPVKTERLVPRAVAMVLAGPTANLLSGCAVLLLPYSKGFASDVFVLFSLVQGSVNLVPYRYKAVLSDGARILMLLGNRERGERWLAAMKLVAELRAGVPPESLSADFLAKAVAVRDDSPDTVGAHAIAYTAALGQRKDAEAAQHLETCLEYSGFAAPAVRQALMSDAAVFQALSRKRADLAERWLAAMPKKIESPSMRTRAEAAILQAKGDAEGALRKLDEMESSLLAEPDETRREISRRSLARWKSALRARGGSDGLPK